jgi:5-methyltetrahydrofolate--homocysteine methyltransferase
VIVAGDIGPTGEIMAPMGSLTHELALEMFHEQAEALKEGGADVLWVETISAAEEFKAAAEAFARAGMPWCGTMSFDNGGADDDGPDLGRDGQNGGQVPNQPVAFGANCGVGASDLLRTVLGFAAAGPEQPIIAKATLASRAITRGTSTTTALPS